MHFRIIAKLSGILKQGGHMLIIKNIPLHSVLLCWAAKQGKTQADNEGSKIFNRCLAHSPLPYFFAEISTSLCRMFLKNKYNIQYMYNIPQQPLGWSKAGQALILRNTWKCLGLPDAKLECSPLIIMVEEISQRRISEDYENT